MYIVCLCKGCDACCVFCLYCDAWSCRSSCMGSMSVSSCKCCIFVSCVHHVADMIDIMWCRAAVCTDVEANILLDSAFVGVHESTISES